MLKLKLQYLGHLMRRADSSEKTLMLGKIEGRKRRGWQRMRWLDGITDTWTWIWVNSGSWWWTGRPGMLQFMGSQRVRHDWATELNWVPVTWVQVPSRVLAEFNSHMGLSPKLGLGWFRVPACGFKSQSVVNDFIFTFRVFTRWIKLLGGWRLGDHGAGNWKKAWKLWVCAGVTELQASTHSKGHRGTLTMPRWRVSDPNPSQPAQFNLDTTNSNSGKHLIV